MTAQATPPPDAERPDPPTGQDRGVSPIAGRFGGRQSRMITMAALAAGCGVFLFATWDRGDADERNAAVETPPRQGTPFEPARRADPPPLFEDEKPSAPSAAGEPVIVPAIDGSRTDSPPTADQGRALAESARRAPLLAYSRSGRATPDFDRSAPPGTAGAASTGTRLDELRRAGPVGLARAGRLPDRNFLVLAGTSLPCVLQTAMDSATPGYVSCLVSRDVYSDNGAVVVMERGTRVLGEYRGALETGRRRLFVLWTRAVTPEGVAVALASPAADALGRSGFDGEVDTHFMDRFGGALLLSILDDGVQTAVGRDPEFRSSARMPSDAAAVALQNSINIPPTLRKPQGAEVSIFVAQDLDFSGVYSLRSR